MSLLFDDSANNAYGNIYWGNETDGSADGRITYFGSTYVTAADRQSMVFRTANTERMRINSSGNVGIGIASPTGAGKILHFNSSSNVADFHITNSVTGTTSTDGFILRVTDPANVEYINREATHQIFYQAGSEKLRIQSGGGISFNGDTATANALDDYEEGVFAPSFTLGSGSITPYSGYTNLGYTKVGRVVTITGMVALQSVSSPSGSLTIGNLPFAMNSPSNRAGLTRPTIHVYCNGSGAPVSNRYYVGFIAFGQNSTSGTLIITHGSGDQDTTPGDWFAAGSDIFLNFTYIAAT